MCGDVCMCLGVSLMCKLKAYQWNEKTQKSSLGAEPEVGVVTAKSTIHQVHSTQVPIQKYKKKEALTVIRTILFQTLQITNNYNIFQQSVTQWSPSVSNKSLKEKKTNSG